ncbi:MAG: GNAT family N-acetyltransferase [Clostridiales bacterium]|nr:GNAT family N-acetyltransferase [Clostridiales bacterium]
MEFEYKKADISSLEKILQIYTDAQAFMEQNGNPQWGKGFPDKNDILGGILGGILYTVNYNNEIVAVFSVVNYDSNYDIIHGKWLTENNYLAVHRVAVDKNARGIGAAKYIVQCAAPSIAKARQRASLRFDTHEKNTQMKGLLSSCGFTHCGTVFISRDGTSRLAYEKLL